MEITTQSKDIRHLPYFFPVTNTFPFTKVTIIIIFIVIMFLLYFIVLLTIFIVKHLGSGLFICLGFCKWNHIS
jgi:hypothetical protein